MKTYLLLLVLLVPARQGLAQAEEIEQLVLNVEKLAQLKEILSNLEKSYQILNGGYQTIKGLSEGNFKLHEAFLDRLLQVSPVVKDYYRVGLILERQRQMLRSLRSLQSSTLSGLSAQESAYLQLVYSRLYQQSEQLIKSLTLLLTPKALRMNDAERLSAIDRLYESGQQQWQFLEDFNRQTSLLLLSRQREKSSLEGLGRLYTP